MTKATIEKITVSPGRRVLVTGDVHGHVDHLRSLLERSGFSDDDLLIIVGDIVQKGPKSLECLRYIMELEKRGNVLVSAGNVDLRWVRALERVASVGGGEFLALLARLRNRANKHDTNLFDEIASELGITLETAEQIEANAPMIAQKYAAELEFLRTRPTVIDAGEYIFVHAGLTCRLDEVESVDDWSLLNVDEYYKKRSEKFDKWVVVGHWPVTLYGDRIACANPLIDHERRLISIDGGIGLKTEGQLNLLIFHAGSDDFTYISEDFFPFVTALDAQSANDDFLYIRWGDNDIRTLESDGECALVEHIRTGHKLYVPCDYLYADGTKTDDISDYHLAVHPGDRLALVRETAHGCFVKMDGRSGLYFGRIAKN